MVGKSSTTSIFMPLSIVSTPKIGYSFGAGHTCSRARFNTKRGIRYATNLNAVSPVAHGRQTRQQARADIAQGRDLVSAAQCDRLARHAEHDATGFVLCNCISAGLAHFDQARSAVL